MDRRKFINKLGRGSVIAGLAAITGTLILRDEGTGECDFDFVCRDCRKLKSCKQPEAILLKRAQNKK